MNQDNTGRVQPSGLRHQLPVWEIFRAFLRLGLTSFGGPIAHLGYFRHEFVERRRWLDEHAYADVVALCQFLPGPASSQVGIALGLSRGGVPGAVAAWLGFTLPSAIALVLFGTGLSAISNRIGNTWLHGLKVVAVAVVAQALWGMGKSLTPDKLRATVAVAAALVASVWSSTTGQVGAIVAAGIVGALFLPESTAAPATPQAVHIGRLTGACSSWRSSFFCSGFRFSPLLPAAMLRNSSMPSIVPGRWSSAADM